MIFNPCFNGTYSLTNTVGLTKPTMYFSFNPCFNGTYSLTLMLLGNCNPKYYVLILVLLELILLLYKSALGIGISILF